MSATEAGGTNGGPSLLSREEGKHDIWWPYVLAPEVGRHTNKVLGEQTEGGYSRRSSPIQGERRRRSTSTTTRTRRSSSSTAR
jgi:hypothetical protein